jgi:hypothetical protein
METRKFTKQEFGIIISQTRSMFEDQIFQSHRVKNETIGLTDSWTNRFDDSKLFERTGLMTGMTLHFLTTCNN